MAKHGEVIDGPDRGALPDTEPSGKHPTARMTIVKLLFSERASEPTAVDLLDGDVIDGVVQVCVGRGAYRRS